MITRKLLIQKNLLHPQCSKRMPIIDNMELAELINPTNPSQAYGNALVWPSTWKNWRLWYSEPKAQRKINPEKEIFFLRGENGERFEWIGGDVYIYYSDGSREKRSTRSYAEKKQERIDIGSFHWLKGKTIEDLF